MYSFWKMHVLVLYMFLLGVKPILSEDTPSHKGQDGLGLSVTLKNTNMTTLCVQSLLDEGFANWHHIEHLTLMGAPNLETVDVKLLKRMPHLQTLSIDQAPHLTKMEKLPKMPKLETLMIQNSGLLEIPNLSHVHGHDSGRDSNGSSVTLRAVYLDGNHINHFSAHALRGVYASHVPALTHSETTIRKCIGPEERLSVTLRTLNYNFIEEIPAHAFLNAKIAKLSIRGRSLKRLDKHTFSGIQLLRHLPALTHSETTIRKCIGPEERLCVTLRDLSNTSITSIPTDGLHTLEVLKIERTPSLKYIPSIYDFPNLQEAELTHHFHCCAFDYPEIHDPARHEKQEKRLKLLKMQCEMQTKNSNRVGRSLEPNIRIASNERRLHENYSEEYEDTATTSEDPSASQEDSSDMGSMEDDKQFLPEAVDHFSGTTTVLDCSSLGKKRTVSCTPRPDALNPCEDVMGWPWLRASVWIVITAAVVGNIAVLVVLLANTSELTVPRFLMCHLAFSDLCTGLYLFMIAIVDLRSFGEFFNYAFDWQYGVGCKVAGFFSVFSGQLSVFTLTIVTLERWFAITYAIYLERRICMPAAAKIMVGGWLFSLIMAGLPLFGISDYSSTSICLPVESSDVGDAVYQGSLFLTNAVAWVTIVICYVQIYRSLGGGGEKYGGRAAAAAAERRIANKMALLIGTDLLCWAPVAFFGVTALAGAPLVDVSHGKVLLVFFYPLNACANPFLYALLTKQYRKDLLTLIARTGKCNWLIQRYKLAATPPPTAHTNPSGPALLPLVEYNQRQSHTKENGETVY